MHNLLGWSEASLSWRHRQTQLKTKSPEEAARCYWRVVKLLPRQRRRARNPRVGKETSKKLLYNPDKTKHKTTKVSKRRDSGAVSTELSSVPDFIIVVFKNIKGRLFPHPVLHLHLSEHSKYHSYQIFDYSATTHFHILWAVNDGDELVDNIHTGVSKMFKNISRSSRFPHESQKLARIEFGKKLETFMWQTKQWRSKCLKTRDRSNNQLEVGTGRLHQEQTQYVEAKWLRLMLATRAHRRPQPATWSVAVKALVDYKTALLYFCVMLLYLCLKNI